MKGYVSKYDKAKNFANSQLPNSSPQQVERFAKHLFAKLIVGGATIGKNGDTGELKIHKKNVHQGINFRSEIQRPWEA